MHRPRSQENPWYDAVQLLFRNDKVDDISDYVVRPKRNKRNGRTGKPLPIEPSYYREFAKVSASRVRLCAYANACVAVCVCVCGCVRACGCAS